MLTTRKRQKEKILYLPIEELAPNGMQPRKHFDRQELLALADSIKQHGFLQPITVRAADKLPLPEDLNSPGFEIIAGERRWRAAKLAGLQKVPCVIRQADREEAAYLALIENLQRKDLGFFEEAEALRNLLLMSSLSQNEMAERLSLSPSALSNKLRLLTLSSAERYLIVENHLSERHARAVLKIRDSSLRPDAIRQIAAEGMTATEAEGLADRLNGKQTAFLEEKRPPAKQQRICLIRDVRFFLNTVERAVSLLKEAGFDVEKAQSETEHTYEISLSVPKTKDPLPRKREETLPDYPLRT